VRHQLMTMHAYVVRSSRTDGGRRWRSVVALGAPLYVRARPGVGVSWILGSAAMLFFRARWPVRVQGAILHAAAKQGGRVRRELRRHVVLQPPRLPRHAAVDACSPADDDHPAARAEAVAGGHRRTSTRVRSEEEEECVGQHWVRRVRACWFGCCLLAPGLRPGSPFYTATGG
jgi:hypothetical protein